MRRQRKWTFLPDSPGRSSAHLTLANQQVRGYFWRLTVAPGKLTQLPAVESVDAIAVATERNEAVVIQHFENIGAKFELYARMLRAVG